MCAEEHSGRLQHKQPGVVLSAHITVSAGRKRRRSAALFEKEKAQRTTTSLYTAATLSKQRTDFLALHPVIDVILSILTLSTGGTILHHTDMIQRYSIPDSNLDSATVIEEYI
jgi:hypothetical protein